MEGGKILQWYISIAILNRYDIYTIIQHESIDFYTCKHSQYILLQVSMSIISTILIDLGSDSSQAKMLEEIISNWLKHTLGSTSDPTFSPIVTTAWNSLHKSVVTASSINVFKNRSDAHWEKLPTKYNPDCHH